MSSFSPSKLRLKILKASGEPVQIQLTSFKKYIGFLGKSPAPIFIPKRFKSTHSASCMLKVPNCPVANALVAAWQRAYSSAPTPLVYKMANLDAR